MAVEQGVYYGIQLEGGQLAAIRGKRKGSDISYLVLAIFTDRNNAESFATTELDPHTKYTIKEIGGVVT